MRDTEKRFMDLLTDIAIACERITFQAERAADAYLPSEAAEKDGPQEAPPWGNGPGVGGVGE